VETADSVDLWVNRPRADDNKKVASFPAPKGGRGESQAMDLQLDAKGDMGFVLVGGRIQKFKVPKEDGPIKAEPLAFSAELNLDGAAERAYMFDHVWRQTQAKLYTTDMGGVDWAYYRQVYERQLPFVSNDEDFAELLSEMLGELNVSHTGSGYTGHPANADATAQLGAFYDSAYTGAGLKVAEVIEGSPLEAGPAPRGRRHGDREDRRRGHRPGGEVDSLLNQKAGKRVLLSVFDPAKGQRFEQVVKPIATGAQNELLYQRWVKRERALVDKLSGGRIGYVHVRGMDDKSYRHTYSELLGRDSGKEAVIVDTRFNGGGNLHDELATLLSGKRYLQFVPRGQELGWEPTGKWTKPSLVLISESNYSDAHLFPWTYHHLGIGKLVGMPVAGTGTAVWWETLQDPDLYFGIPEVGFRDAQGNYMEKALIQPDVQVANDPARIVRGEDQQLEAGVQELLKGLPKH
jgi:C-terminal processing protease CtpA/Prc